MTNVIISTSRYIQGKGELEKIYNHVSALGDKVFILVDAFLVETLGGTIRKSFEENGSPCTIEKFNGECSKVEINRLLEVAKDYDVIIGVGGGKTLDTSKAVAFYKKCPVVIVPTAASTDAPCSALSVVYTEDGVFEEYLFLPKNPDMVIVDSQVIANAPVRLFIAGIGDALATYFEARATLNSNGNTIVGAKPTKAGIALAKLCYETIIEDGLKATLAVENHTVTKAVDNVIEANTYLSGVGFESGGLAAAHAIHNGMTAMPETHHMYHGEKVAFGTITQLVLENIGSDELNRVIEFCVSVGLPITLGELGVKELNVKQLQQVAEIACAESDTMGNMPFDVKPDDVVAAMIAADALGRHYHKKCACK
ncbi:glycerol dehydrogenase [Bacillus massiliigorillae]|uniref:glycerol dehydrogenase n=1 Tax=Bacillus massiliigorillae TaxID=1243664 RepID=UPI0003A06B2A|nr:glycerol dehydrogenase [Bacillus massiliigorillae]